MRLGGQPRPGKSPPSAGKYKRVKRLLQTKPTLGQAATGQYPVLVAASLRLLFARPLGVV